MKLKKIKLLLLTFIILSNQPSCSTLTTNFHAVKKNQFYRSAQLSNNTLEAKIRKHKIRTVINLRGEKREEKWYKLEKKLCEKLDIEYVSTKFRSKPSKEKIEEILFIYENSEYPIYIHCEGGRDRVGLASAIYLINKGEPIKKAFPQLTHIKYRNIPLVTNREKQRTFFKSYADFCKKQKQVSFKEWITYYYKK